MTRCSMCNDVEVHPEILLCAQCAIDSARGYHVRSLAGRCADGFERGHGTRFHAVRLDWQKAFCGAKPGKRSVGWSDWGKDKQVNCPRCLSAIAKAKGG